MLEVRLLGGFEVRFGKDDIHFSGRPEQSLFAYLILNGGVPHRREKLTALLWPDSPEDAARENLRHVLWKIRKALSPPPSTDYLLVDGLAIAFDVTSSHWLDVTSIKSAGDCKSSEDLISAMSVYRGELLPGFMDDWVVLEREYLNFLFEHNMARLMALLHAESRWLDTLNWGERWLAFGQRPEPAYRALMYAHMKMGETSKVADTYFRCLRSLQEIGLDPSEQTKNLYEKLKSCKVHG